MKEAEPKPFTLKVATYDDDKEDYHIEEREFKRIEKATNDADSPYVAVSANGDKVFLINVNEQNVGYTYGIKAKSAVDDSNRPWTSKISLNTSTHVLSNGNDEFIGFSNREGLTKGALDNWNVMKTLGFAESCWV